MSLARYNTSAKWGRLICLIVCFALVLSSLPIHLRRNSANAQSSGALLKRQLPPYYKLPNINSLLAEGRNLQRPTPPRPPLKPSTICGYRDEACKRKMAKEKKVGQNFTPSNDNASQISNNVAQKRDRNWLGRLGRAFSNALSEFTSVSAKGNSFLDSDLDRNAGTSAPDAFNNTAVSAAPAMPPPTFGSFLEAKLDPRYRVGGAGEDLFSGNYNFRLPVVSLPGRVGLDLNLTVSYNSLVWIKWSNIMSFDYDYYPTLTPGFRIGFLEVQGPYYYNGVNTYIVYLPSGRRVEMRQVTTNKFEAIDSSYLYLDVNAVDPTQMTLYSTDGTQYKFERPFGGNSDSRCTQIKDSNGNYISIIYKNVGDAQYPLAVIDKVIDTLGREIIFEYDGALHLLKIKQNWNGQEFIWAQFEYGTKLVTPNFGSLYVDGPNNANIPIITRIITGDGARHTFSYNSWGQVDDIRTYGEADNQRAAMVYAFPPTSSQQSDCPRFTQRNDGIYAWPGDIYDPQTGIGWVVNYFYFDPNETYGQVTGPDGVTHKEFFSTSGGTRGLTTRTEAWYGGAIQQFTDITWASDSAISPPLRPRVTETKICDDRNHNGTYQSGTDKLRKTTVEYTTVTTGGSTIKLPWIMREYNEGGGSVYRSVKTDYVTGADYLNRRIIGLPNFTYLYQGDLATLKAQTEFVYDSLNGGGTTFLQAHSSAPRQHDSTSGGGGNYGTGFRYRGNLTKVLRYSVVNGSAGSPTETKTGYYITGTVALTKDAMDHLTSIFYDDSFLHYTEPTPGTLNLVTITKNPATFAYPTKVTVTDPPYEFSSTASYNYDFGAVTRAVDPKAYAVGGQNPQTMSVRTYDSKGRLDKSLVWKDGAKHSQTRYAYGTDHNWVQMLTTVNTLSIETAVLSLLDGVGRERIVINEHPGSDGQLSAYYRVFDNSGRVNEASRPTEINNATWAPDGDDETTGYVISLQSYDWKGRPLITTNPDNTTRQLEYVGCGCAGGDVVITRGERVTDSNGNQNRRTTKTWRDAFGRTEKVQALNWGAASDTDGSVYSTTSYTYNVRDQVENIRQQVNDSGAYQDTVMNYDGYGRLSFRKRPEEGALGTTYTYQNDDMLATSMDARGASATFTYNARHLVTNISYASPNESVIPDSPTVTFQYDERGNRTVMNDGAGTLTYGYDNLGRLTSESRYLSELASHGYKYQNNNPIQTTYQIGYSYNLVGQLQQITTPTGDTIDYERDKIGRTTKVSGTPRDGVTDYVSNIVYRAWGAEKSLSFGYLNYSYSMSYNGRMQVTGIDDQDNVLEAAFAYTPDGKLDTVQGTDRRLDRSFSYDHVGRVKTTRSASAAGLGSTEPAQFTQDYGYDEFNHMTTRQGGYWYSASNTFSASYSNNIASNVVDMNQAQNWQPDAEGNVTSEGGRTHKFDVAGRRVKITYSATKSESYFYDGDGRLASETLTDTYTGQPNGNSTYYLWSSVLQENLAQIRIYGRQYNGDRQDYYRDVFIYANGQQVAVRKYDQVSPPSQPSLSSVVYWEHRDPLNTMARSGNASGRDLYSIDPLGVQARAAYESEITGYWGGSPDPNNPPEGFYQDSGGNPNGWGFSVPNPGQWGLGCSIDGIQVSCGKAFRTAFSGTGYAHNFNITGGFGWQGTALVSTLLNARIRVHEKVIPGDPNEEREEKRWTVSKGLVGGEPFGLFAGSFLQQQQGGGQQKVPCPSVIPTDPDQRAVWNTLMGESEAVQTRFDAQQLSQPGAGEYGPDQYGRNAFNSPNAGLVDSLDVLQGMRLMIDVIQNRLTSERRFRGKSWRDVVTATYREDGITKYEFEGYPVGAGYTQATLGDIDSEPCERSTQANNALHFFRIFGVTNPNITKWRGIKQIGKNGIPFIRKRGNAIRVANTDFF